MYVRTYFKHPTATYANPQASAIFLLTFSTPNIGFISQLVNIGGKHNGAASKISFCIFFIMPAICPWGNKSTLVMTDWSVNGWAPVEGERRKVERWESIWVSEGFNPCLALKRM